MQYARSVVMMPDATRYHNLHPQIPNFPGGAPQTPQWEGGDPPSYSLPTRLWPFRPPTSLHHLGRTLFVIQIKWSIIIINKYRHMCKISTWNFEDLGMICLGISSASDVDLGSTWCMLRDKATTSFQQHNTCCLYSVLCQLIWEQAGEFWNNGQL